MILLALDTALDACSVAVVDDGRTLAARSEPMSRGHQERLAGLVGEIMAETGVGFEQLDRLGVVVGPGSFTGLRVGLAFAKGLSFALSRPLVGIGALEALAASEAPDGLSVAAIDARREQIYLQAFRDGEPACAPEALGLDDAVQRLTVLDAEGPRRLVGSGAPLLAAAFPRAEAIARLGPDPVALARLAAVRSTPADPMYLRAPDAKVKAS